MDRRTRTFECTNTSGPFLVALELLYERERILTLEVVELGIGNG
jgi:hypothetical protein